MPLARGSVVCLTGVSSLTDKFWTSYLEGKLEDGDQIPKSFPETLDKVSKDGDHTKR